jgi:hypothetical protein
MHGKPVDDVMRIYRQPFLAPNMADATHTGTKCLGDRALA